MLARIWQCSGAPAQVMIRARRFYASAAQPSNDNEQVLSPEEKLARDEHLRILEKYYPPNLVKSIIAAESAVSPDHYKRRHAPSFVQAPPYADDYSEYDPFYDHARGDWVDMRKPQQPVPRRYPETGENHVDVFSSRSASAVNLTKLSQLTGLNVDYLRNLKSRVLIRKRVVNMTRLGKIPGSYSLVAVGDGNGYVGIGEGRDSKSQAGASARAHWEAAKNLKHIPRFQNRTIFGTLDIKQGAVVMQLRSALPGSGLRVNHIIYEICKLAGIRDLVGNVYRSRNKMNVAKTAVEALSSKQVILDEVAANRGKRVVDVTSAYLKF